MMRGEEGADVNSASERHWAPETAAIRHVVFDFDGTIADTLHLVADIYNGIASEMNLRQVTPSAKLALRRKTPGEVIRELGVPLHRMPFIGARIVERLKQRIGDALPFEGMPEVCRALHESGVALHIVSSNSDENIRAFLARHRLQCFEEIVSGGTAFGKHRLLRHVLEKQGAHADSTVYIGDEVRDISAARRVGMRVVSVGWGYSHPEILSRYAPDHLVSTPAEIAEVLEKRLR